MGDARFHSGTERLREAWTAARDPKARLEAIKALDKALERRFELMRSTMDNIRRAGKAMYHVAGPKTKARNRDFWESLGETEDDKPRRQPSMRL